MKITLFFFIIFFIACSKEQKNGKTIFLDSKETKSFSLSKIIKNEKYIPLETNEKSIIGYINKMHIHNNVIYILDSFFAKKLLAFDLNGKYLYSISKRGNGPGEYVDIIDFVVTDDKIYILDDRTSINEFDINGKFLKETKLEARCDLMFKNTIHTWVLICNSGKTPNTRYNIYITNNDYKIKKGLIESIYSELHIQPFQQLCTFRDTNYFYLPLENKIYSIKNNILEQKYELKYPKDCVLSEDEFNYYKKLKLRDRYKILDETILLSNLIITESINLFFYKKKNEPYIYILNNNHQILLVAEKNIQNDVDGMKKIPKFYNCMNNNNRIVGCLFANDLINDSALIRRTNPKLNMLIKNFRDENNPIISIYSINENAK